MKKIVVRKLKPEEDYWKFRKTDFIPIFGYFSFWKRNNIGQYYPIWKFIDFRLKLKEIGLLLYHALVICAVYFIITLV